MTNNIQIPTKVIGTIKINGNIINEDVYVPLSTYELALFPSVSRGAKVSRLVGGVNTTLISETMTRSIILEGKCTADLLKLKKDLLQNKDIISNVAKISSDHIKLQDIYVEIIGKLIFIRFSFTTDEASGHNMVTKAVDYIIAWICGNYKNIKYVSVSGNMCVDKKNSAINGILGRGRNIVSEITIPESICKEVLHTTPTKIHELNIKKNLVGSILAGSVRSANAHFANMLLATYLATGQDAANIVEGSQGTTYTEVLEDGSLYFSVNCPNIIVGTVGNGKNIDFVKKNLALMGCNDKTKTHGENAQRLGCIIVSAVLCGELSLLAAQSTFGALTKAHEKIERGNKNG